MEEGGDHNGFVAVSSELEVERLVVVDVGKKGGDGVDGDHEEDADDVALLRRAVEEGEVLENEPGEL